jgi:ADP-ribose pyrophosphatase YjhB (NUDIX family)
MIKIPPHARCVFQGVIYDVYHWEQRDFNGNTEIYEALSRRDVAVIIAIDNHSILMAREEQPVLGHFWSHFGGFVEPEETPLEAAQRELLEESGMIADDWTLAYTYEHPGKVESRTFIYVAHGVQKTAHPQLEGGEKIEVVSVSWRCWLALILSPEFRGREELMAMVYTDLNDDSAHRLHQLFFERPLV